MFKIFGVWEEDEKKVKSFPVEESNENTKQEEVWQIALDIIDNDDSVIIVAPIAGVELQEIDLYLNKNILTLRWAREKPKSIYNEEAIIKNEECFWWRFVRNIILPENLEFKKIKAVMENNLLIISIPKITLASQNVKIDRVEIN